MSHIEKKQVFFVLEFEVSSIRRAIDNHVWRLEKELNGQRAYLYESNYKQVIVGSEISRSLQFSSADLAIQYLNRNEVVRSIRPFARLERLEKILRPRIRKRDVA